MIESYVLLAVGLAIIGLRIWVRARAVGWKGLRIDDYLMLLVVAPYSALMVCAHISLVNYGGLSNDGMTPMQRELLDPQSTEYSMRMRGAQLEIVSRIIYTVVLWLTKGAMLGFCRRLTERFGQYEKRIRIGFVLLGTTWLADFLITMLSCRPFPRNWQIQPDPGEACHPATSPYSLFGTLSFNIFTSLYVFFVPLPILWMANIKIWKKVGLIMLVSANCFVIAVAILRGYLTTAYAWEGARQASRWAARVSFVAVATTNLPLFFPLICRVMAPLMKMRPTQMRRIRTITVWERTGLTVRMRWEMQNGGHHPTTIDDTTYSSDTFTNRHRSTTGTGFDLDSVDEHARRNRRATIAFIEENRWTR
ncbi:hypothetical protein F4677DRAFT_465024 [Hypoxylon crocopeplum]|nr:hypothetical protein F4677DRAFT_465024 [Hypoxylon crocopeplum]